MDLKFVDSINSSSIRAASNHSQINDFVCFPRGRFGGRFDSGREVPWAAARVCCVEVQVCSMPRPALYGTLQYTLDPEAGSAVGGGPKFRQGS